MLLSVCSNSAAVIQRASRIVCDAENAIEIAIVPKANMPRGRILVFISRLQKGIDMPRSTEHEREDIESQRQGNCVSCSGRSDLQSACDNGVAMKSVRASNDASAKATP